MNTQRCVWQVMASTCVICFSGSAAAATFRLEDAGSYPLQPNAQMQWRSHLPKAASGPNTQTQVQVQIRIDTRAWVGKQGRIYMVLPLDPGPHLSVEWRTQGRLLPGRLLSGQRGLVYTGPITRPILEDQLVVLIRSDAEWASNSRRLDFHFELDTE
ncbi:MAG: hypothetical protein JWP47_2138 [Polaromonas sp.]|jgi:hypothetical protein|nr:hypothetical protein [Polaromonas sp.]